MKRKCSNSAHLTCFSDEYLKKELKKRKLSKAGSFVFNARRSLRIQEQTILKKIKGNDQLFFYLHLLFQIQLSKLGNFFPDVLIELIYIYLQTSLDIQNLKCLQQIQIDNGLMEDIHVISLLSNNNTLFCLSHKINETNRDQPFLETSLSLWSWSQNFQKSTQKKQIKNFTKQYERILSNDIIIYVQIPYALMNKNKIPICYLLVNDQIIVYDLLTFEILTIYNLPFLFEQQEQQQQQPLPFPGFRIRNCEVIKKDILLCYLYSFKKIKIIQFNLEKQEIITELCLPRGQVHFFFNQNEFLFRDSSRSRCSILEIWNLKTKKCVASWSLKNKQQFGLWKVTKLQHNRVAIHLTIAKENFCAIWKWKNTPKNDENEIYSFFHIYPLRNTQNIDNLLGNINKQFIVYNLHSNLNSKYQNLHIYQHKCKEENHSEEENLVWVKSIKVRNTPLSYSDINKEGQIILGFVDGLIEIWGIN